MVKRDRKGKEKPQCPKGTGGGGRLFRQHCSQQSQVGTGTSVLPRVSEPRAAVPKSCCCTPTGPLTLNQASSGAAGCVLMPDTSLGLVAWLWPGAVLEGICLWSLLMVGVGSWEAAPIAGPFPYFFTRGGSFSVKGQVTNVFNFTAQQVCVPAAQLHGGHMPWTPA